MENCVRENLSFSFSQPLYDYHVAGIDYLTCWDSNINSFEGIEQLSDLSAINMPSAGTLIEDLTPLTKLPNLNKLNLPNSLVSDLSPLQGMSFHTLNLAGNKISDLEPLRDMKSLMNLFLNHQAEPYITDISPLDNLTSLKYLVLQSNKINDLEPLRKLTGLQHLYLKDNLISSMQPLEDIDNLITLDLSVNKIDNVSEIPNSVGSLRTLKLANNKIKDLDFLNIYKNIQVLDIRSNFVSDITPIQNLNNPYKLLLDDNSIKSILPLKPQVIFWKIYELSISFNCIEDLNLIALEDYIPTLRMNHICETPPAYIDNEFLDVINTENLNNGLKPPVTDNSTIGSIDNSTTGSTDNSTNGANSGSSASSGGCSMYGNGSVANWVLPFAILFFLILRKKHS